MITVSRCQGNITLARFPRTDCYPAHHDHVLDADAYHGLYLHL